MNIRPGLPPLPDRMRGLLLNDKGYPVPFFVAYIDGKPDFRVMASIDSGLPSLKEIAQQQGPEALLALDRYVERGLQLVPAI